MRTTIEIDRDLLEEAVRVTGAPTKSVAVRLGLKALMDASRNGIRLFPVRPDAGPVTPELVKTLAEDVD